MVDVFLREVVLNIFSSYTNICMLCVPLDLTNSFLYILLLCVLNCFSVPYCNKPMFLDCICIESALSHAASPSLSEFGPERSPLVVQLQSHSPTPTPPAILQDLQQPDSTSYVLLTLAKGII